MHIILWLKNVRGRKHLENLGVDGRVILEWILGKYGENGWTGRISLRIGTSGELL
jgi:hypothetical protein